MTDNLINRKDAIGKTIKDVKISDMCPGSCVFIFTDDTMLVVHCHMKHDDTVIKFNPHYSEEIIKEIC